MSTLSSLQDEVDRQTDVTLSENVAEDFIEYIRGNQIANASQALLGWFQLSTGWMYPMESYVNLIYQGPPGGGKSLTQENVVSVIPDKYLYSTTRATDNALLDDSRWDQCVAAPFDEYDKLGSSNEEYLKSMAGEDGGMTKKRDVEDDDSEGGYSPVTVSSDAMPFQLLYAPRGKKGGIDEELDDRMFTAHVEDSKEIREAIGRKEAGHEEIDVPGLDPTYIYDTTDLERALRNHMRELPVRDIHEDGELSARRGGSFVEMPQWVWYACYPIFDRNQTYTNRVYGMVFNLMRASALLNHHERETTTIQVEYDDEDDVVDEQAYVVAPQDVANVLACQRTLLSTTHQLGPTKRNILDAVKQTQGTAKQGMTTVSKVVEWLDDNDRTHPSRTTLKDRMDSLHEDYFLRRVENGGGANGQADLYAMKEEGAIRGPRVTDLQSYADGDDVELGEYGFDVSDPFDDCVDPIRGQPIKETFREFESEFSSDDDAIEVNAATAMTGSTSQDGADTTESSENSSGGQQSLGDVGNGGFADAQHGSASDASSRSEDAKSGGDEGGVNADASGEIEFDEAASPSGETEQAVYDRLCEEVDDDGKPVGDHHTYPQYLGVVDTNDSVEDADLSGTIFDPDHRVWQERPDLADDRVRDEQDTLREVEDAYESLRHAGLVAEDYDGAPKGFKVIHTRE